MFSFDQSFTRIVYGKAGLFMFLYDSFRVHGKFAYQPPLPVGGWAHGDCVLFVSDPKLSKHGGPKMEQVQGEG